MSMKKLRVGVVGVGHIGSNHARLYAEIPSAEFAAVYDVDLVRGNAIGRKFGATPTKSLDEFIGMVDAASVATPTNTHYEIARSLLERGKHVLVEKPITDSTGNASELADLAARNGLILQVGHVERFNPVLSALETHLTNPRLIDAGGAGLRGTTWGLNAKNRSNVNSLHSLSARPPDASGASLDFRPRRHWSWRWKSRSESPPVHRSIYFLGYSHLSAGDLLGSIEPGWATSPWLQQE